MGRKFVFSTIIAAMVIFSYSAFAQSSTDEDHRITQPITVNGQPAMGVLVVRNGAVQTLSCDSPQPYVTENRSESGWACLEQATGMWLLPAQPPSSVATAEPQQSPTVIYSAPDTIYDPTYSYSYGYPYRYYPYSYYSYPYFWGPGFGLGFGFNFGRAGRGFHGGHGFAHGGSGFAGGGPVGHGPAFTVAADPRRWIPRRGGLAGHRGGGRR